VKVALEAHDKAPGSGIVAIYYRLNAGDIKKIEREGINRLQLSKDGRVSTYKFAFEKEGIHKLEFWAEDLAGNKSDPVTLTIKIDKTPPAVQLSPYDDTHTGSVTINWSVSDTLSDVANCQVFVNDSVISTSSSGARSLGPGSYKVRVEAEDRAGNRNSSSKKYAITPLLSLPQLEVSVETRDFGKVEVGSSASRNFTITNRGDAELKGSIQCSSGNCGAFSFSPSSFSLGKQETSRITVRFSPSQEKTYRAVIGIESNGGNTSVTLEGGSIQWSSYLSDIQESSVQVGWGSFHKDMFSKRGETRAFILDGKTYQKGLDTHAPAHVIYNLNGQFKRFQSFVGLWDSGNPDRGVPGDPAETRGSVRFIVVLNGQQVYDSGVMRWDTPAKSIDIDVSGAQILELRVMDVEDLAYDWSIWADAKLLK